MTDEALDVGGRDTLERGHTKVRVRGRGALVVMCRWGGIVAAAAAMVSFAFGDVAALPFAAVVAVAALWQIWLFRPGITVTGSAVRIRGLVSDKSIPVEAIHSFGVARIRRPLDHFDREVSLVIHLHGESDVTCRWIGWQDLVSAWFTGGERPLPTPSQKRVLDRLNTAVSQP